MQQHSCKCFVHRHTLDPRRGVKRSNHLFFLKVVIVAYQIKAKDTCSNMVANVLSTDTPSTPGMESKGQTISFSESSHCCISNKRELSTEHHESKYAVLTHTLDPWGGVERSIFFFFSENGLVAYQIKVKEV